MTQKKKKEFMEMTSNEKITDRVGNFQVPYIQTKEEAFLQLKEKIAAGKFEISVEEKSGIRPIYWFTSAAAVIFVFLGIWYGFIYKPVIKVVAQRGQHTELSLPDGSKVALNAESQISYQKKGFNKSRYVSMEGEAFFTIKKGQTFTIHTIFADIRILGTSFNVLARKNAFKVSCLTGKVCVTDPSGSLIIAPGESVVISGKDLTKFQDKHINSISNWKIGEFSFEDAQLNMIFNEIERQFNITFVTSLSLDKMHFTGSFSNKNLADALDIVCIPMGLTYEIGRNDKIFIKEKKE
jgi:transmembrane sensor